jgi:hypothetical protein
MKKLAIFILQQRETVHIGIQKIAKLIIFEQDSSHSCHITTSRTVGHSLNQILRSISAKSAAYSI